MLTRKVNLWYLATPYSKFPGGIEAAFNFACWQAALLVRHGVPVFSPITHTHPIAVTGDIDPMSLAIWLPQDQPMMDAAGGVIMCMGPTWADSLGMEAELHTFRGAGKPVVWMAPNVVPPECLQ